MLRYTEFDDFRQAGIAEGHKRERVPETDLVTEAMTEACNFLWCYQQDIEQVPIGDQLLIVNAFACGYIDGTRNKVPYPNKLTITFDTQDGTMLIKGRNVKADEAIAQKLLMW